MERQRKPRIDLIGYENDFVIVEKVGLPNKWLGRCKSCDDLHQQSGREIQRNQSPMSCENYKPPNWSGLEKRDAVMRASYGISLQQFNDLLDFQDGKCAICLKQIDDNRKRINVDHDHETNVVRGLLCSGCNTGLGHLGDNIEGIKRALYYLENTPFSEFTNALAR